MEFSVLGANSRRLAMSTRFSRILLHLFYYFQSLVQSSHVLFRLGHGPRILK
jgi:hypothetical protein